MIKRLTTTFLGMLLYTVVAYSGNLITGVAKHSSFLEVLGESLFFGIFVFLFQSFRQKDSSNKNDKTS